MTARETVLNDPTRIADVVLAAAVRARADAAFIEPGARDDDAYTITLERGRDVLSTISLDAQLASAVIARLAFLAELDLAASHPASAVVPVRSGDREAEVVITVRPGAALRADLMVMSRHPKRPAAPAAVGMHPGEVIGNYKLVEFLGEGGMGTVYLALHPIMGRKAAVKVLKPELAKDEALVTRFFNEARAANAIRHPNIIDIIDVGMWPEDNVPYMLMEFLEGESLASRLDRSRPLDPGQAVEIGIQTARRHRRLPTSRGNTATSSRSRRSGVTAVCESSSRAR